VYLFRSLFMRALTFVVSSALAFLANPAERAHASQPLELHIDADFSVNAAAAEAIALGMRAALHTVGNEIAGRPVVVIERDHVGNVRRAHATMLDVAANPNALAMFGGLHSPPYVSHGDEINAVGLPTLLPWSAAAPLTRVAQDERNFIFRLSIDDSKAAKFLVRSSVNDHGCSRIAVLLLDTIWGRSNHTRLVEEIEAAGAAAVHETYFKVGTGPAAAKAIARDIVAAEADCVIMLLNSKEGAYLVNGFHEVGADLAVFSHWGISGSTFDQYTSHEARSHVDLRVLQTCNAPDHADTEDHVRDALSAARAVAADETITQLADIPATVGFVHGYDLTLTLVAAATQASRTDDWQGDIVAMRAALKTALESLEQPVEGIMDHYAPPFRPYVPEDRDAHEALGLEHLCFRSFDENGRLPWSVR
jgi:branched-chain amino acid transport system substrate-binding protein